MSSRKGCFVSRAPTRGSNWLRQTQASKPRQEETATVYTPLGQQQLEGAAVLEVGPANRSPSGPGKPDGSAPTCSTARRASVRCRSFTVTAIASGCWIIPVTGKPKPVVIGPRRIFGSHSGACPRALAGLKADLVAHQGSASGKRQSCHWQWATASRSYTCAFTQRTRATSLQKEFQVVAGRGAPP